jgi:subtilisin family serine protease
VRSRVLVWVLLAGAAVAAIAAPPEATHVAPRGKIAPWLQSRLNAIGEDSFLVLFDDAQSLGAAVAAARGRRAENPSQADHAAGRAVYDALRQRARLSQAAVRDELTKAGIPFRTLYIVNGLAVRGNSALAHRLAAHGEVVRIVGDPVVRGVDVDLLAPVPMAPTVGPEWGVTKIEADKVWTLDNRHGEGIVVASADTGVLWTHPAIKGKYRGWNGTTANHDFNWFDAIQNLAAPTDPHSHGTHTTGTMVGDGGTGNQIGVAPGARWIACRNMDSGGNGTPSSYIACNQFFLAPYPIGGDPETDGDPSKSPDIVNNSWTCPTSEGCDPDTLQPIFAALRAAGILAVAAAGNSGTSCSSVAEPPGIYDETFVVGATDVSNFLANFSSRGPVTIDGSNRLRPDVAAPGVDVRSSVPPSSYANFSGTSMASPHTAGAAALLWSAKPQVRGHIGITRCLLSKSARPIVQLSFSQTCGGTSATDRPNNLFGYGLIDAYDAIHLGPDGDTDGIADACDCAPADHGAFDAPPEADGLRFNTDKTTLTWPSLAFESGSGTLYDVIKGDLDDLRTTGDVAAAACVGSASNAASLSDPVDPDIDKGVYYVIQARNACGLSGFGAASDGTPRLHATCP